MSRLTPITEAVASEAQRALREAITGGKRGRNRPMAEFLTPEGALRGPFNALMHSPALGLTMQRLGEMLRFEGALSGACREIAILVVGAHWRARYEWWAHARIARALGVSDAVLDAIARGQPPTLESAQEQAVHAYASELVHTQQVSDDTYSQARALLGEPALVELTILLGYYTNVSMILNAFQVPLPAGESTPFDIRVGDI